MKRRAVISLVAGTTAFAIAGFLWWNWHLVIRPYPKDGWQAGSATRKFLEIYDELSTWDSIGFDRVCFENAPLEDCLQLVFNKINALEGDSPWTYEVVGDEEAAININFPLFSVVSA